MSEVERRVNELIEGKLNNLGYSLISSKYQKEGKDNYLHIVVDADKDISLDDIVLITDLISPLLDTIDIIKDKYILDISSFGIEKSINVNSIDKYIGKYINIHLSNPYKGMNNIIGTLNNVNQDEIIITYKIKTRNIPITLKRKDIDKANLAIKF